MKAVKLLCIALFFILIAPAEAYVGPGAGLGFIGALIGLIGTVFMAIFGVFYVFAKNLLKKKQAAADTTEAEAEKPVDDDPETRDKETPTDAR